MKQEINESQFWGLRKFWVIGFAEGVTRTLTKPRDNTNSCNNNLIN
jgi:hypothetical protein